MTTFAHHTDLGSFGCWVADILHRSHQLIGHGPLLAADDTDAATHTFVGDDRGLHLPGTGYFLHFNGVKRASFEAVLAANASLFVDGSLIAAAAEKVKPVSLFKRKEDFAGQQG